MSNPCLRIKSPTILSSGPTVRWPIKTLSRQSEDDKVIANVVNTGVQQKFRFRDLSHCPKEADQHYKKTAKVGPVAVKHILHFDCGNRDECTSGMNAGNFSFTVNVILFAIVFDDCWIPLLSGEGCRCYADNDVDFVSKRQIRKMAHSVKQRMKFFLLGSC